MKDNQRKTMRDAFIERIYERMGKNRSVFFLSADFGAPALDKIRRDFRERFINVGIAEQGLINVAAGLGHENYAVFAYAIAPFISMRAYEQTRQNLSIRSQIKPINVNLIGVSAGLSYDLSGPSHHCLEDIAIMRTLPNMIVFSPSDWKLAEQFADYSIRKKAPKYLRFEGKSLPLIYKKTSDALLEKGFCELKKGKKVCLVSTGFMTHTALEAAKEIKDAGVIDVFMLNPVKESQMFNALKRYKYVVSLEEGFINRGGLDSIIFKILRDNESKIKFENLGFRNKYVFEVGDRNYLHKLNKLDKQSVVRIINKLIENQ